MLGFKKDMSKEEKNKMIMKRKSEVRENKKNIRKTIVIVSIVFIIALIAIIAAIQSLFKKDELNRLDQILNPELARAMTYAKYKDGDEDIEGTDNVKFSAFFLRDLDGDGYAEKIKGTCKNIGGTDTLYFEINVQTEGYLKDAKIKIDGKNFYLQTVLPKDDELKKDYIESNSKTIEFEQLNSGTQKLIFGVVKSGDYSYSYTRNSAIGKNTNNYSRSDNTVTLTGTYVDDLGTETPITKVIPLTLDWYGTTNASFNNVNNRYTDLPTRIHEEEGKIELDFQINTIETNKELNIYSNYVEGTIPPLNGYNPIEVTCSSKNCDFSYSKNSGNFNISRRAEVDENGIITKSVSNDCLYTIKVIYPLEAYSNLSESYIELVIPVSTYFSGYNNRNREFSNPYVSNRARTELVFMYSDPKPIISHTNVSVNVGEQISWPRTRWIIKKDKPLRIYNGVSTKEIEDYYKVEWYVHSGTGSEYSKTVIDEGERSDCFVKNDNSFESMENLTSFVGISFSGRDNYLKENGWIKVYDAETGVLLLELETNNLKRYTEDNPFYYDYPVKHIRIETSENNPDSSLVINNIKELDDEYITGEYSKDAFDNLKEIEAHISVSFEGGSVEKAAGWAIYEEPFSVASITTGKKSLTTQKTEEDFEIVIDAKNEKRFHEVGWKDGSYLIKLPQDVYDIKIKDVFVNNPGIEIISYEIIEKDDESFIKINTKNEVPAAYKITIITDLTPNILAETNSDNFELYAINREMPNYYYNKADIYDVDNDEDYTELVANNSCEINFVAPNSLITTQSISNFDNTGTVCLAPKIADVKPIYDESLEKNVVTIGLKIKNNYARAVSELDIVGKIPFEENTYVISQNNLNSQFSTKMLSSGVVIPDEIKDEVTVYYSDNENPTKEISDTRNNWKTKEEITDWDSIKTYLIDFDEYVMQHGKEFSFSYEVEIPYGIDLNKISYSHHGVFFSLNTEEGKYKTKTEPNKVGIRVAEKYLLELNKLHKGKEKKVSGATYKISELDEEGAALQNKTAITSQDGIILMDDLYAERIYELEEIIAPDEYELSSDKIKFIVHVDKYTGEATPELLEGTIKGDINVFKDGGNDYKAQIKIEDEAKASIKVVKTEKGTNTRIPGVKFVISGTNTLTSGVIFITDSDGIATIPGLTVGDEYSLVEMTATGYYLDSNLKFKISNNNGTYGVEILESNESLKVAQMEEIEDLPVLNVSLEDEKIPTYDLEIVKIKNESEISATDPEGIGQNNETREYLQGAKFRLYKEGRELGSYITDENGKFTIHGLYQYEEQRGIDQTYILKEVLQPEGYSKVQDIEFSAQVKDGKLQLNEITTGDNQPKEYTVSGNTVSLVVEDYPIFKLIKKDGETGEILPNTKFAFFNIDDGATPARNSKGEIIGVKERIGNREYHVVSTDSNGEISLDLPEGLYQVIEVEPSHEKYSIANNKYYFGIGKSRESAVGPHLLEKIHISGSQHQYVSKVVKLEDETYVALIRSYSPSGTISDYINGTRIGSHGSSYDYLYAVKFDKNLSILDSKRIETLRNTASTPVVVASKDGGIIIGGYQTSSSYSSSHEIYVNKYDSNLDKLWSKNFSSNGYDQLTSLAETSDHGVVLVGKFDKIPTSVTQQILGSVSIGKGSFILKLNQYGTPEWGKNFNEGGGSFLNNIAIHEDNIYLVGQISGDFTLNGTHYNVSGGYDGAIIKFDNSGNVLNVKILGGEEEEVVSDIIFQDDGYVIACRFNKNTNIDGNELHFPNGAYYNYLIAKFDYDDNCEFVKEIVGDNSITSVTLFPLENGEYIAKFSYGGNTVCGKRISSLGKEDTVLLKFSENSELLNVSTVGSDGEDTISSILDSGDNRYIISGTFDGREFGFLNDSFVNSDISKSDSFIGLYVEGYKEDVIEAKNYSLLENSGSETIACSVETETGGVLVGGKTSSSSLLNGQIKNDGGESCFLIKYDSDFNVIWSNVYAKDGNCTITAMAKTTNDEYIVCGNIYGSVRMDDTVLISNGGSDGYVAKFDRDGKLLWAKNYGGTQNDNFTSVAVKQNGDIVLGGTSLSSSMTFNNDSLVNSNSNINTYDGIVLIVDSEGQDKFGKFFGGEKEDLVKSLTSTSDGGFIIGGEFESNRIPLGNGIELVNSVQKDTLPKLNYNRDGMVIKFDSFNNVQWARNIGGELASNTTSNVDSIRKVIELKNGHYAAAGYFESSKCKLDEITIDNTTGWQWVGTSGASYTRYGGDALIVEYDEEGKVVDCLTFGKDYDSEDRIGNIIQTNDEGYLITYETSRRSAVIGVDRYMRKYSKSGAISWERYYPCLTLNSVVQTVNDDYFIGSTMYTPFTQKVTFDNGTELKTNGGNEGLIFKNIILQNVGEEERVTVENKLKTFDITTDIIEIDGVKGGTISGEDDAPYETVEYGHESNKEIEIVPEENYEIVEIKVNGSNIEFVPEADGTLKLPLFDNIKENK